METRVAKTTLVATTIMYSKHFALKIYSRWLKMFEYLSNISKTKLISFFSPLPRQVPILPIFSVMIFQANKSLVSNLIYLSFTILSSKQEQ
jgi:hypothetical protein